MTSKFLVSAGLCIASAFLITSCVSHDLGEVVVIGDCENEISYNDDIKPIVTGRCAIGACHNGSMGPDLDWRDPAKFQANADEAKRRVALPATDPDHMPKNGTTLPIGEIQKISCWADQGAPTDN